MPGARGSPASRSTTPSRAADARARPTTTSWSSAARRPASRSRLTAAELRDQVAPGAGRPAPARRRAGRPGRGLPAEHPRDAVLMLATASLGAIFSLVRAGVRHPQRHRPVAADRAEGAGRRRRLPLRRQGRSTAAPRSRRSAPRCPSVAHRRLAAVPRPDAPPPDGAITWADLRRRAGEPLDVRARCRSTTRSTSSTRPAPPGCRSRSCTATAASCSSTSRCWPAPRPRAGRPVLLVHHHRLDDVELPGLRPRRRRRRSCCSTATPRYPDLGALWRLAERARASPTSAPPRRSCWPAARRASCRARSPTCRGCAASARPARRCRPRASAGSTRRSATDVQLPSLSGGTDVCTGFVGGSPAAAGLRGRDLLPLPRREGRGVRRARPAGRRRARRAGHHRSRCRRCRSASGATTTARATARPTSRSSPGVWRHGDWITITDRGTCVITGRSDATLNRGGVRLGTAEFYSVVEALPEVADCLVVHLEDDEGGAGELLLFVVLRRGRRARRRPARRRSRGELRTRAVAAARARRDPRRSRRCRARCRARSSRCR